MLLLTSDGLSSPGILEAASRYIQCGKAALVVTADNVYKANNYHVPRLVQELGSIGFQAEFFDFDKQTPEDLWEYDAVELMGGNPYYLLHSIRTHGFCDVLREFASNRMLIGCSAGTLVCTPSLYLIDQYTPEMNIQGLEDLTALCLTDLEILPHYRKFLSKWEDFEEKCAAYESDRGIQVIRLNDGCALFIESDGKIIQR